MAFYPQQHKYSSISDANASGNLQERVGLMSLFQSSLGGWVAPFPPRGPGAHLCPGELSIRMKEMPHPFFRCGTWVLVSPFSHLLASDVHKECGWG